MTEQASSDILCQEIRKQSETEAATILEQAGKEAEQILKTAKAEAEKARQKTLGDARNQAEADTRRTLSSVHLEVRKQNLRNREAVMSRIFEAVAGELETFRGKKEYGPFLKSLIVEGIAALDSDSVVLKFAPPEAALFESVIEKELDKALEEAGSSGCRVKTAIDKEAEGGVLILSENGRTSFDNRFSARLKRFEAEMRLEVMKQVFEE